MTSKINQKIWSGDINPAFQSDLITVLLEYCENLSIVGETKWEEGRLSILISCTQKPEYNGVTE